MPAPGDYVEPTLIDVAGATVILACRQDVQNPKWKFWKPAGWLWEIAHSADSQVQYSGPAISQWRHNRTVMFGPDKSSRSRTFHALRMHFPSLVQSRATIVIHCFDGYHHSPLFLAMMLAVHGYEGSLASALSYIARLRPIWAGYLDHTVPDCRSCRETLFWAETTVRSLQAEASAAVRWDKQGPGTWLPVTREEVPEEEAFRYLKAKSKPAAPAPSTTTTYTDVAAIPPPFVSQDAEQVEKTKVEEAASQPVEPLFPAVSEVGDEAMTGGAAASSPQQFLPPETEGVRMDVDTVAPSAVSERGVEAAKEEGCADATMGVAPSGSSETVAEKAEEIADPSVDAAAPPAASETGAPHDATADTAKDKAEEGYWHRDSKKCQPVWRRSDKPLMKKEEEDLGAASGSGAAGSGAGEGSGLKLESLPKEEGTLDEEFEEIEVEVVCMALRYSASSKRPSAADSQPPTAKARTDAEWIARRRALQRAIEELDSERGGAMWLQKHNLHEFTDTKHGQSALHLLAEDLLHNPTVISRALISEVIAAAASVVNVASGQEARPSGTPPLHQFCAGNDSGELRRFCVERLVEARANLEARDARGAKMLWVDLRLSAMSVLV